MGTARLQLRRRSQAEVVALWLGTFELIKAETMGQGHVLSNDSIALATTSLVPLIDVDEPWIGRHLPVPNA